MKPLTGPIPTGMKCVSYLYLAIYYFCLQTTLKKKQADAATKTSVESQ